MSPGHWQRLKLLMRLLIQMIDDRGQMTDVGRPTHRAERIAHSIKKSEDRCQRAEGGCQRIEVGRQRIEVGRRTRRRLIGRDYAAAKDGEVGKLRKGQRA
jgi:hypothetical protein